MQEIGITLKNAREKKHLTLLEVQEATKIRLRYLEAIENGNLEIIPGEVYRKGFIGNYATAVGLDSETILKEYQRLKAPEAPVEKKAIENKGVGKKVDKKVEKSLEKPSVTISEPKVPPTKEKPAVIRNPVPAPLPSQPTAPVEVQSKETKKVTIKMVDAKPVIMVATLLLIGIGVFFILKNHNSKAAALQTESKPSIKAVADNKKSTATTIQQLYPAPLTVYAEFSEDVWIQLKIDGKMRFMDNGVTFTPKSPKQLWTANSEMIIRVGNPAGIKLTLNGKDMGVLGETNVAKTFILTAGGMEESKEENWQHEEARP